ncbi:MAG: NosD domain-containing protein [Candidatus Thorarchaeota archaeon]
MKSVFLRKYKYVFVGLVIGIVILSTSLGIYFATLPKSNYHPPIIILSNADFLNYDFPGNGTQDNPYIIEDLIISASGSSNSGILIRNTDYLFIIKNCLIYSDYLGISLIEVAAGTSWIINNTCISKSGDGGGVVLNQMTNSTIVGNLCINFMQGIHINHVSHCVIKHNTVENNNYQGINIRISRYNKIINNTIKATPQHAIALVGDSDWNKIYHNFLINNSFTETYNVDGRLTGIINSQGFDEGSNNYWYDEVSNHGNFWSDYQGIGNYSIDGPAGTEDIYPNNFS